MKLDVAMLFVLGSLVTRASVEAQDRGCCIVINPVVELSTAAGAIVPSTVQSVIRTQDNRFAISHLFSGIAQFALYDATGNLLRLYEKAGEGPGELRRPPRLYSGPGNTIWAVEVDRLIRLDDRLRHIDTKRLENQIVGDRVVVLQNGATLANRRGLGRSTSSWSVIILDSAGTVSDTLEAESNLDTHAILAHASRGGFWALRMNQSVLRRYSSAGQLLESVPMVIGYVEESRQQVAARTADPPPPPAHVGLLDIGDDLVVILTQVPDAAWAPMPSDRMFRPAAVDYNQQYDTILGLVDLRTGQLVQSMRVPELLRVVDGARDLVHTPVQDDVGHVTTKILRVGGRRH